MERKIVPLPRVRVYLVLLLCLRAVSSSRLCGDSGVVCPGTPCCCHDGGTHVNCTGRNLTDVPASLLEVTETLDLSFNNISSLRADAFRFLPHLQKLLLIGNRLSTLDKNVFRGLRNLEILNLKLNRFQQVPSRAFRNDDLASLQKLHLDSNWIHEIPPDSFMNLTALHHLNLNHNQLTDVPTAPLSHLGNLRILHLENNLIGAVPDHAFAKNGYLSELSLRHNQIQRLSAHAFAGLPYLWRLEFMNNSITSIAHTTFRNLPALRTLVISEVKNLSTFPDLTGTTSLQKLGIDRCSLRSVPANFCENMSNLEGLNLHNNQIESLPSFSKCSQLSVLDLSTNKINSLEGQPFFGLHDLFDLNLHENDISYVPADAFKTLSGLDTLSLRNNSIREIDSQAFASCTSLQQLFLNNNSFPVLPTTGLQMLLKIYTSDNEQLEDFPPPAELPSITEIATSYAYHCCDYIELAEEYLKSLKDMPNISEITYWDSESVSDDYNATFDMDSDSWFDFSKGSLFEGSHIWYQGANVTQVLLPHNVTCKPKPGPFMPCVDLFGSWPLRIGIWLVFLLAIVGNAIVIFVILVSHTKMDVPRFLICNLAVADFFLGVYLGFLAGVDTSTLGVFRKFGARWQLSAGCRLAGFLAVFSSELSIYTLSVITLERFYAIKHALHLEKRMKLPHAVTVMGFGWAFSLTAAVLPLVNVSNYYRFPVCLPFNVDTTVALCYVSSLLILNILAFVIIMACYASIYLAIQGSHAWNCNDSRVARRMSLLVFTDFACWAPIAFFSLTEAYGVRLISLDTAKVLTIFVLPLNSCANPFLYTILTKQFKKDCRTIMRTLSNRVFRQRSMSRSITLSLGRHPSMRSTQAHQISQLRWRTNGSISQDLTGDPCLVSFKTENGETSSNVYTVSMFGSPANPCATETSNTNGTCSHEHSRSDSSTMLDPAPCNQSLADPRRGSRSPLLDLVAHARVKTHDYKPKAKTRRKFSIPIPFLSNRSPSKTPAGDARLPPPACSSPPGPRHKRSHSVTEGLLHRMGKKKPLASVVSCPGAAASVSQSSEHLQRGNSVHSEAIRIIMPQSERPGEEPSSARLAEDGKPQPQTGAIQDPASPSTTWFGSPCDPGQTEVQCLLESPRSYVGDPSSPKGKASEDVSEAERRLGSSHDNPVRVQLSSAHPSPLLHRPQELELVTVPATDGSRPDCDSGLGTASSPLHDSNEYAKFLAESPPELYPGKEVCAGTLDNSQKTKSAGIGSLLVNLTRSEQSKSYNKAPTQGDVFNKPRESVV